MGVEQRFIGRKVPGVHHPCPVPPDFTFFQHLPLHLLRHDRAYRAFPLRSQHVGGATDAAHEYRYGAQRFAVVGAGAEEQLAHAVHKLEVEIHRGAAVDHRAHLAALVANGLGRPPEQRVGRRRLVFSRAEDRQRVLQAGTAFQVQPLQVQPHRAAGGFSAQGALYDGVALDRHA